MNNRVLNKHRPPHFKLPHTEINQSHLTNYNVPCYDWTLNRCLLEFRVVADEVRSRDWTHRAFQANCDFGNLTSDVEMSRETLVFVSRWRVGFQRGLLVRVLHPHPHNKLKTQSSYEHVLRRRARGSSGNTMPALMSESWYFERMYKSDCASGWVRWNSNSSSNACAFALNTTMRR